MTYYTFPNIMLLKEDDKTNGNIMNNTHDDDDALSASYNAITYNYNNNSNNGIS